MNPAPLYLLAPLALFLVTLVLYRISPLRAVAAGHARWFILPAFTLFIPVSYTHLTLPTKA